MITMEKRDADNCAQKRVNEVLLKQMERLEKAAESADGEELYLLGQQMLELAKQIKR